MEEVLDEYDRECPEDTARISFDERPCQLVQDVYAPIKMEPGKSRKYDIEYQRNGTACLLMAYDIDSVVWQAQVRQRRTKNDFAEFFDWLEKQYAHVSTILVILDNLNTHHAGTFYEFMSVDRAMHLRRKFRFIFLKCLVGDYSSDDLG